MSNVQALTFLQVPSSVGGMFAGKVSRLLSAPREDFSELGILPFLWTISADWQQPLGWQPATSRPIPLRRDGAWFIRIAAGIQYAALLVPMTHQGVDPFDSQPGILPTDDVIGGLVAAELGIVILGTPDLPLAGVVTAYRTGYPNALGATLRHLRANASLQIHLWVEQDGETTEVAATDCQPSGFWSFGSLDWPWNRADRYALAATTNKFLPTPNVPRPGGPVVAVTWCQPGDGITSRWRAPRASRLARR